MGNLIVNNLIPNIANVAVTREGHSSHRKITNEGFIMITTSSECNKGIVRQRVTDLVTLITSTLLFIVRVRYLLYFNLYWFLFVVISQNKSILSLDKLVSVY